MNVASLQQQAVTSSSLKQAVLLRIRPGRPIELCSLTTALSNDSHELDCVAIKLKPSPLDSHLG